MKRGRAPLLALALAAVLLGALVAYGAFRGPGGSAGGAGGPGGMGAESGAAAVGGPFQMVDQDGRAVDQRLLDGQWNAVFFGYTSCPDVCPATLQAIEAAKRQLGPDAAKLQTVFVSVDPARDTPEQVKQYLGLQGFPQNAVGLTGTKAQVDGIVKAYKAYYAIKGEGDGYLVDHSSAVYLMDPQGRFNRVLSFGLPPEQMARLIREAMRA